MIDHNVLRCLVVFHHCIHQWHKHSCSMKQLQRHCDAQPVEIPASTDQYPHHSIQHWNEISIKSHQLYLTLFYKIILRKAIRGFWDRGDVKNQQNTWYFWGKKSKLMVYRPIKQDIEKENLWFIKLEYKKLEWVKNWPRMWGTSSSTNGIPLF